MGTNFYWKPNDEGMLPAGLGTLEQHPSEDDPARHIGKRSAAGAYCYDCGVPLIESPPSRFAGNFGRWSPDHIHGGHAQRLDACPDCGGTVKQEDLRDPGCAVGIELGFAKPLGKRPRGVGSASSFSWAQEPARVILACRQWPDETLVVDEYGRDYTGAEFLDAILVAPLWFTDRIGGIFS